MPRKKREKDSSNAPAEAPAEPKIKVAGIPIDLSKYMPQIQEQFNQMFDERFNEKMKELTSTIQNTITETVQNLRKIDSSPAAPPSPTPEASPASPADTPTPPTSPENTQPTESGQPNPIFQALLAKILTGGSGGFGDKLKEYAEIKQAAEIVSGGSMTPKDIFDLYRSGMLDSMRMLTVMTRKKFPEIPAEELKTFEMMSE